MPNCQPETTTSTRFFEFTDGNGHTFQAWTSDSSVINQVLAQLALPEDQRDQHINGKLLAVPEGCRYNQHWSWYFDPNDWTLAEISIEVCDGNPQYVEDHLADFLEVGRYCPWSSHVLREIDNPFDT
ncbi:MAG: hypothetical protein KDC54_19855 [Lewinella sp.]|nr:hypothetical protein [Lewinella sp.]